MLPTSINGCVGSTFQVDIQVDPEPVGVDDITPVICSDQDPVLGVNYDLQANVAGGNNLIVGTTYVWVATTNSNVSGESDGVGGTGQFIDDILTNVTNVAHTVIYTVTPTSINGCDGSTFQIDVQVDPEPVGVDDNSIIVCSGQDPVLGVNYDLQANVAGGNNLIAGTTYAWIAATNANVGGESDGGNTGQFIDDVLTNVTNSVQTVVYTVTPTSTDGCDGNTFQIDVQVDPEPTGFDDLANPANELCSRDFINYNIQTLNIDNIGMGGNGLPTTFTYLVSSSNEAQVPTPILLDRLAQSTNPITDSYTNTSGANVTITYTITPFSFVTGCEGNTFTVEFVIYSEPEGVADALNSCSDIALNYDINNLNVVLGGGNGVMSDFTYVVSSDNVLVSPEPNRTTKSALPITNTYTNTSAVDANITYTITPISQANNCVGQTFDVVFTIQVEPAGANYSETQCGGVTLNHNLNNDITNLPGPSSAKFYYTVSSNNVGVPAGPDRPFLLASDANITDPYNNTTASDAVITYIVIPINKSTDCEGDAFTVVFTIEPGPAGALDNQETCSNVPLNYDIQSDNIDGLGNSVPGKFSYLVVSSNPGNVPAEPNRSPASTLPITHNYVNTTAADVIITYTITPEGFGAGCVGAPFNVTFTIHPEPVVSFNPGAAETICSGDPITTSALMDIPSSTIFWEVISITGAGVIGVSVGNTGITATIPHIITNVESGDAVVTYQFTGTSPATNSCVGQTADLVVTVRPEPVMNPGLTAIACSDDIIDLQLTTDGVSVIADTYKLISVTPNGGLVADIGNASTNDVSDQNLIRNDKFTNVSNSDQTVDYIVEPTSGVGCVGAQFGFSVTIRPEPVLDDALNPFPTCSDVISGIILTTETAPLSIAAASYNIVSITFDVGLVSGGGNASIGAGQADNALENDTYTNTTNGVLFAHYTIIPVSADGCEGDPTVVDFEVNPAPALSTTIDQLVCTDEVSGIILATTGSSEPATSYDIINIVVDAGLTPIVHNATFPRNTADVNDLGLESFENLNDDVRSVTWEIVPITAATCSGPSLVITLRVEPTIDANISNLTPNICTGDQTDITISTTNVPSAGSISYNISVTSTGGVFGFVPNLNNLPSPYTINDILTNNGAVAETVTYAITPRANSAKGGAGCIGDVIFVDVVVEPNPAATATVNANFICSGDDTDIDLTSSVAGTTYTWTVVDNPDVTGEADGSGNSIIQSLVNSTLTAQTVTYTITPTGPNPLNCVGPTTMAIVTVNPQATVDAGLPQTLCEGEVVVMSGTMTGLNQLVFWSGGAGNFSNPTSVITTYFPAFGETGNVVLTLKYTDGSGVCADVSDVVTITINEVVSIFSGPGYVICEEEPLALTEATMGGSATDVLWTIEGGGTGTFSPGPNVLNPTFTPDAGIKNTLITLKLTGSDISGICAVVSSNLFITVNADPVISISTFDPDREICESDQIVYSAFGAQTYQFFLDDGTGFVPVTTVGNLATLDGLAAGTYTIKAEGTASTTCSSESPEDSFTVIALPPISLIASTTSFCEGDQVEFTASGAGTNGLYKFLVNDIPVQGPGSTDIYTTVLLQNGDVVKVVGTEIVSNSSCENTSVEIVVSVSPAPSITLASSSEASNNIICLGDEVTFTATSDIAVEYTFKIDGINVQKSASNTFATSELITGSSVTVEVTGPDPASCNKVSESIQFIVNPVPTAVLSGTANLCKGGFANLQIDMTGRIPFTVVYNDGSSDITLNNLANLHFITVQPETTTTYKLISITDANGCTETSLPGEITVTVEGAVALFSIEGDLEGCSPLSVTFKNEDIKEGVTYLWEWGDGSAPTITTDATVTHKFENNSTTTTLSYNVTLIATNNELSCQDSHSETVQVFPSVLVSVLPSTEGDCGPVSVSFINNTLGASTHKWFYRLKGTTDENEVITSPFVTYELSNKTSSTVIYEVVYEASNGNCKQSKITEVFVLPELIPSYETSQNPIDVLATPHVTITNTTLNKAAWTYKWEWGDGNTTTSVEPGSHTYLDEFGNPTFGTFEIIERISFQDANGSCDATTSTGFTVDPVFPEVDFEVDVTEGCRPLTVNFTNLSVSVDANTVFWEFINDRGVVIATSEEYHPAFTFHDASKYTIRLTAGNAIGVADSETKEFLITVNELPVPSFTLRPETVFLPDGVVFTQNLSTNGADNFFWIFNILDYNANSGEEADLISTFFEPEIVYKTRGWKDIMLITTITATGCADSLLIERAVFVDEGGNTRIPNAFSPNPSGPSGGIGGGAGGAAGGGAGNFNDIFLPVIQGLSPEPGSFHMLVYDRWGNLIFESWDEHFGWDGYSENGKLLPLGVYVYKLDLKFIDGSATIRIGDVTLIR